MDEIQELLNRYEHGVDVVAKAIGGASDAELDFRPAPGKWTPRQIISHLADTEAIAVIRFRQVVAEDNPVLINWNQDAWADNTDYDRRDPEQALRTIRLLREDNSEFLQNLPDAAFLRTGNHTKHGPVTLKELLRLFAQHTETHSEQIRRIRDNYQTSHASA